MATASSPPPSPRQLREFGLLIGIVQSVMSTLWPEGARLMIYVAMAAVLLLRPHGLLGRKG